MRTSLLVVATAVSLLGLVVSALGSASLSMIGYILVLTLGTVSLSAHRFLEVRRSLDQDYVIPTRWVRRLAAIPAVLVLVSCLANAYVWATEVSKL